VQRPVQPVPSTLRRLPEADEHDLFSWRKMVYFSVEKG